MGNRLFARAAAHSRDHRAAALKVGQLVWLAAVWVMLWGEFSVANAIVGLFVGLAILMLAPMPPVPIQGRLHVLSALKLIVMFVGSMALGSLQVAWLAIRPGRPPMSAVLRTRVRVKSDLVLTLLVDAMNLIPGTVVLDVDTDRRLLYVHVLDVSSEKAVRRFYADTARLENLLIRSFERDSDWQPEPAEAKEPT